MSSEPRVPRRPAFLAAFAYRDFRLLWSGLLVSNVGTWMQFTAIGWHVARLAPDAAVGSFDIGLVGAARAVPVLLLSPFAGVVADRFPRRPVLLLTNGLGALVAALLAVAVATGHGSLAAVLALSAAGAAVQSFDAPARQSWVPILVPRPLVGNAIGLNSIAFNAPAVIGPPLAGLLIAGIGIAWCFAINALATLAVVAALVLMAPAPASGSRRGSVLRSILEGVRFIAAHPVLRWVVLLLVVTSATVRPYNFLLPAFAVHELGTDARGLGVLLAASGAGAILGAVLTAAGRPETTALRWVLSAFVMSAGVAGLGAVGSLLAALPVLFAVGAATLAFIGSSNTLLQTLAPDEMRGRAISVYSMVLLGVVPLGSLLLGALATLVDLRVVLVAGGIAATAATAWIWAAHPALRRS